MVGSIDQTLCFLLIYGEAFRVSPLPISPRDIFRDKWNESTLVNSDRKMIGFSFLVASTHSQECAEFLQMWNKRQLGHKDKLITMLCSKVTVNKVGHHLHAYQFIIYNTVQERTPLHKHIRTFPQHVKKNLRLFFIINHLNGFHWTVSIFNPSKISYGSVTRSPPC